MTHEQIIERAARHTGYRQFFMIEDEGGKHVAQSKEDFQKILNREAKRFGTKVNTLFKKELSGKVRNMIKNHDTDYPPSEYMDYSPEARQELNTDRAMYLKFATWLSGKKEPSDRIFDNDVAAFLKLLVAKGVEPGIEQSEHYNEFCKNLCKKYEEYGLKYTKRVSDAYQDGSFNHEKHVKAIRRKIIPRLPIELQNELTKG